MCVSYQLSPATALSSGTSAQLTLLNRDQYGAQGQRAVMIGVGPQLPGSVCESRHNRLNFESFSPVSPPISRWTVEPICRDPQTHPESPAGNKTAKSPDRPQQLPRGQIQFDSSTRHLPSAHVEDTIVAS